MIHYIDEKSIYAEARMLWSDYKKACIYVEGETDKLFLSIGDLKESNIIICPLNGWELVYKTVQLSIAENFKFLFGIIDKDYHYFNSDGIVENDQLAFTDENDVEMMLFYSSSFDKFLRVYGSETKLKEIDEPRSAIVLSASYIGAFRAISLAQHLELCFEGYSCSDFIDKNTISVNLKSLIKTIFERSRSKGKNIVISNDEIEKEIKKTVHNNQGSQLCNGHDVMEIVCLAMQKLYGTTSSKKHTPESVFSNLLMGYTIQNFHDTVLYKKILQWIDSISKKEGQNVVAEEI